MTLTLGGIAAVAFATALTLMHKRIGKKAIVWLMILAGVGITGVLGSMLQRLIGGAIGGIDTVVGKILGASAVGGLIVLVILTIELYPHLKPKSPQPPTKATPWLGFAYSSVLVTVGGIFSTFAGLSQNIVTQAAGLTLSMFTSLIGGL